MPWSGIYSRVVVVDVKRRSSGWDWTSLCPACRWFDGLFLGFVALMMPALGGLVDTDRRLGCRMMSVPACIRSRFSVKAWECPVRHGVPYATRHAVVS